MLFFCFSLKAGLQPHLLLEGFFWCLQNVYLVIMEESLDRSNAIVSIACLLPFEHEFWFYLHHYLAWVLSGILFHGFLFRYLCIRDGDFIRARTLEYGMLVPEHLLCLFLGVAVVTLHVQVKFTLLFDVLPLFQVSTPILPCVFFLNSSSDCPSSNRTFPGQGRSILEIAVNPEDRTYSSETALQHFCRAVQVCLVPCF